MEKLEEGFYIAVIKGEYGKDEEPWGFGGIRDFVFINNTNRKIIIGETIGGHITTDDGVVDLVTGDAKNERKTEVEPYGFAELDSMDWDGYIEYNADMTLMIEGERYYINQRSVIKNVHPSDENFMNSLKTIPIVNKLGVVFNVTENKILY